MAMWSARRLLLPLDPAASAMMGFGPVHCDPKAVLKKPGVQSTEKPASSVPPSLKGLDMHTTEGQMDVCKTSEELKPEKVKPPVSYDPLGYSRIFGEIPHQVGSIRRPWSEFASAQPCG